ncbi:hypothetical protein JRI60_26470 [Archangium violaceum]|uniref:hypothetical protein n=1 Tax=Archangium violaceum TaxID=83451 RepID=UPI00194F4DA2|nr:hypothetical protein [Archangium violaceum]QRO02303.1 hypothetical protein JRI60_26470 [Archangium violaceum]
MKTARLAALIVSGGICSATHALAQTTPGTGDATSPAATQPAPTPPPAVATPPAPAAGDDENIFRFYGTLTPRFIISNAAVESFNQPNASAITAAGNPAYSNFPNATRHSFQVAQSRAGFWLNEKGPLRAQLEVDFVDFTKATPTVASLPRLRLVHVDYTFHPGHTVSLGQDWDLHAPINPHGINLVGALFQAGNSGFMRQQFKYLYSTPSFELGAAIGFPAPNVTAKDAVLEIGALPTLAVRGTYKFGKSRVGASALATRLPFNFRAADQRYAAAFAATLFSELAPSDNTNLRVELNFGQNSANLGLLSLAQGRASDDLRELGGFISVRQVLTGMHAVYGMAGYQKVLDASKVVPSYDYPAGAPIGSATLSGTGPGMVHNGTVRVGYELKPSRRLAFVLEGFLFQSHFRQQAADVAAGIDPDRTALGLETGAILSF